MPGGKPLECFNLISRGNGRSQPKWRKAEMKKNLLQSSRTFRHLKALWLDESGQDLIEYALVVALIALAATAGMSAVATNIGNAFTSVGTKINTYTS
jgi:pilus assembly protein Flp/PilA